MQKVEGSSPFIRSQESPAKWGFFFGCDRDIWRKSRTGQWEWGARTFRINTPGYYTVWAQYHWYPFYQDPGGSTRILQTPFLADYMNGSYMGAGDPYCHYR